MPAPQIDLAPQAPSRNDSDNFDVEGDAFLSYLELSFVPQLNTALTWANQTMLDVDADRATVAADKALTLGYKNDAETAVTAAGQAANAPKWVSGTNYADGNAVWSPIDRRTYRRKGAGAGVTDPSADPPNWAALAPLPTVRRVPRTANTILGAADAASFIDVTANTFTQTFSAAATLGDGWYVWYRNAGTGNVTLDPNGAETIDGLTSFIMYPGEARLIQCDGAALRSFVVTAFSHTFASGATFIKPPGYSGFGGIAKGGGGGGGGGSYWGGAGGGGGAAIPFAVLASDVAASVSILIGAGGTSGTAGVCETSGGGAGGDGGTTSFGSLVYAFGGQGGGGGGVNNATSSQTGAAGGSGLGVGVIATASPAFGTQGGPVRANNTDNSTGCSEYGGAGGARHGSININPDASGGGSLYGGAGGGAGSSSGFYAGGVGGRTGVLVSGGGAAGGVATGDGNTGTNGTSAVGSGGGGGGCGKQGNGGNGADAGGGGGGGVRVTGLSGGAGGVGGAGSLKLWGIV